MSTRGASACVRKTPTGLPDWTSSVSSSSSARSAAHDARRSRPSCAPPCRCRRRRRGRRAARRPRGRGCSSACAARPPAAQPLQLQLGAARGADDAGRRSHSSAHSPTAPSSRPAARSRPAATQSAPAMLARRLGQRPVAFGAEERRRAARGLEAPREPRPAVSGAAGTRAPWHGAQQLDARSRRAAFVDHRGERCGPPSAPMRDVVLEPAPVGIESTVAGWASTLFSETSAAAVYCAIMKPGVRGPRSRGQERRQAFDRAGLSSRSMRRSQMSASSATAIAEEVQRRAPPAGRGSCRREQHLVGRRRTPAGCR